TAKHILIPGIADPPRFRDPISSTTQHSICEPSQFPGIKASPADVTPLSSNFIDWPASTENVRGRERRLRQSGWPLPGRIASTNVLESSSDEIMNARPRDLELLLTAQQFNDVVEYLAVPDSICTPRALAVIQDAT
ncbi:unnamed protein product, partial [Protopolystoma xenopodis]